MFLKKKLEKIRNEKPYRRWHTIAYIVFCLGWALISLSLVVGGFLGSESFASTALGVAAIMCVIAFFLLNFLFWRCPQCHKTLPIFGPVIICQYCKKKFMDENGKQTW